MFIYHHPLAPLCGAGGAACCAGGAPCPLSPCPLLVLQNCLVSEKNGFVYLNEIFKLTYPGKFIWKFLSFWLSYYYESLILGGNEYNTVKSTLAF